jgi:hypothetical protein
LEENEKLIGKNVEGSGRGLRHRSAGTEENQEDSQSALSVSIEIQQNRTSQI